MTVRFALPIQDKSMYDASHELPYLDMVTQETLRMYPPVPGYVCINHTLYSIH